MGYIGNQTTNAFSSMQKQDITGDGGASYTLSTPVANAQEIEVFVNNVRQEPGIAYTASGTALTMTGNVESTDDFYVVYQGKAVQTSVPADDTITTAMLKDGAVTSDKIGATSFNLSTIKDSTGTNTALSVDTDGYVKREKNCAFFVDTPSAATYNVNGYLGWDNESFDTDNCFNHTTGTFTAPVNGIYHFSVCILINGANYGLINWTKNEIIFARTQAYSHATNYDSCTSSVTVSLNANDTLKLYWYGSSFAPAQRGVYSFLSGHLISAL